MLVWLAPCVNEEAFLELAGEWYTEETKGFMVSSVSSSKSTPLHLSDMEELLTDDYCLMINIKTKGKWAVFAAHKTFADCLLRPGVLRYKGSAKGWLKAVPRLSLDENMEYQSAMVNRTTPLRVPSGIGLLVIDYDEKTLIAAQGFGSVTKMKMSSWGFRTKNAIREERKWVREMVRDGLYKEAIWNDGHKSLLPEVPSDVLNVLAWWERELRKSRGLPKNQQDTFDTEVVFPLHAPDWTWKRDVSCYQGEEISEVFQYLLPSLSEDEIALWKKWAQKMECEAILSWMRHESLNVALPERDSGPSRPRF